jgi:hypothetical protein
MEEKTSQFFEVWKFIDIKVSANGNTGEKNNKNGTL